MKMTKMSPSAKLRAAEWDMKERGWWLHPIKGSIVRELPGQGGQRWFRYHGKSRAMGPYKTALEAAGLK